jgi:CubicO group peptidase (beta-lactamase class C family)
MRKIVIEGRADHGFEQLADVLGRMTATQTGGGAALSVYRHGHCVAELSVGAYSPHTRQLVFSVSKLLLAIALHRVAERGHLDLDASLEQLWPAFGAAGGSGISLRDVLAHRTSLGSLDVTQTVDQLLSGGDRHAVLAAAASATKLTGHAYHAVTYGTIIGAVVEEALGKSVPDLLQEEIASPLGIDVRLGQSAAGVAPVHYEEPAEVVPWRDTTALRDGLLEALLLDPEVFNSDAFLRAGLPSMGVVTTAAALSRVMASTIGDIDGVSLLAPSTVSEMTQVQSAGIDGALGVETSFGSGPQLVFPRLPFTGHGAFGHEGAGGSVAFADPELGLAVGFTTDVFPAVAGASPVLLGLLPTLRLLAARA